jgi:hypothetical protein
VLSPFRYLKEIEANILNRSIEPFVYHHTIVYNYSLQPTIHNDNVNQFKVGLESDNGYFTLKVKTMTLMSHFFLSAIVHMHYLSEEWKRNDKGAR